MISAQSLSEVSTLDEYSQQGDRLVYLVRHGESLFNVPDPATGMILTSGKSLTAPLTEEGHKQADQLGQNLAKRIRSDAHIVICFSAALRAQETAEHVFRKLQEHGFSCELDPVPYEGLCELSQGRWEGQPKDEAYKTELKKWEDLSAHAKFSSPKVSDGESYDNVVTRFVPDMNTILQKHPGKLIVVVSHHWALNAALLHLLMPNQEGLSEDAGSKLPCIRLHNCEMVTVAVKANDAFQNGTPMVRYRTFK